MKTYLTILLLTIFLSVAAWGQRATVFTETMGTVVATTTIATHEANNGFDNDDFTMTSGGATNPGDIRTSNASSGYSGASGAANVWLTSTAGEYGFAIEGINTSIFSDLQLQFGYRKESASALPTLTVEYWDGTQYNNVPFNFNEAANASTGWYLSPVISLPSEAIRSDLRLRWRKTGSVACRIDDVVLTRASSGPSITISKSSMDFGGVLTGDVSAENSYEVSGSNLTNNIIITAPSNYEISTGTGGTFNPTNPITLTQSSGTVSPTQIYVRFKPTGIGVHSGNITNYSDGADTKNVNVTGYHISLLPMIEYFEYTEGTTLVNNGWVVHSAGSNPITVGASPLIYTNYPLSGTGKSVSLTSSGEDLNRKFTEQTLGSIYASLLVKVTDVTQDTSDYFFHLGPTDLGTTYIARVYVKKNSSGDIAFCLRKSSSDPIQYTGFDYSLNETYLIVVKYQFNGSSSDDIVSLFVFSQPVVPSSEPFSPTLSTGSGVADASNLGTVALRQGTAANGLNVVVDGLRISTSWDDVPLPIQLGSFVGNFTSTNDVLLEWQTISEINNLGFYVERKAESEEQFVTVSELIPGAGYSLEPRDYSWTDTDAAGTTIEYRLKQVDNDGLEHYYGPITVTTSPASVKDNEIPAVFKMDQNYPNPFNPLTIVNYQLPIDNYVTIKVYNILGNEIATLADGYKNAGYHKVSFDGTNLSTGIYFYKIQAGNFVDVKKLTLMK